jgi:hypothetical protein
LKTQQYCLRGKGERTLPGERQHAAFALPPRSLAEGAAIEASWHEFPKLVLVQPNGFRIPGEEFLDGQAVNQRWTRNPFLLAIDEDGHELQLSLASRALFGGRSFAVGHGFAPISQLFSKILRRRFTNALGSARVGDGRMADSAGGYPCIAV